MTSVAVLSKPPFSLKTLVKDSNCVLIQDPSAIWGGSDHLPRRNLLTYSEDFSNAAWLVSNGASANPVIVTNQAVAPDGTTTADQITFGAIDAAGDYSFLAQVIGSSAATYTGSVYLKAKDAGEVGKVININFNLDGGTVTRTLHTLTADWVLVTNTRPLGANAATRFYIGTVGSSAGGTNQAAAVAYVWGAQVALSSTTDQSYQRVTDWVTEQYAWAAQKNVPWLRRNMLGYSSDLTNAAWVNTISGTGVAPTITQNAGANPITGASDANRVQLSLNGGTSTSDISMRRQAITITSGHTATHSVYVRAYDGVSTYTAQIISPDGNSQSVSISGSWSRISSTTASAGFAVNFGIRLRGGQTPVNSNTADLLVYCHQVEVSGSATAPQNIATTWPAEYTSLALAAGYPISLYSDRAGTTATVGPDDPVGVLLDQSEGLALGPELVVNGAMSSETGWTKGNGWAFSSGTASCTTAAALSSLSQNVYGLAVTGKSYKVSMQVTSVTANGVFARFLGDGANVAASSSFTSAGTYTFILVAPSAASTLTFEVRLNINSTVTVDNISVREIPGYHATAPSDAARPNLRLDGNGKFYLDRDTTDDALAVTWPANFTTTAVQYVADQSTTTETTGITLNGATSYNTPQRPTGDYGRIIFKTPTSNAAKVKKYLDKKAGR